LPVRHLGRLLLSAQQPGHSVCPKESNQLRSVPIQAVTVDDSFWPPKRRVWQEVTIPDCFTKFENDRGGALHNFDRVRDGQADGHAGPPWFDGLVYEMIRGATSEGEAFGADYFLPNNGYLETCGAVAAGFFDRNLNLLTGDARYVDALERELYNGEEVSSASFDTNAAIPTSEHPFWRPDTAAPLVLWR